MSRVDGGYSEKVRVSVRQRTLPPAIDGPETARRDDLLPR